MFCCHGSLVLNTKQEYLLTCFNKVLMYIFYSPEKHLFVDVDLAGDARYSVVHLISVVECCAKVAVSVSVLAPCSQRF